MKIPIPDVVPPAGQLGHVHLVGIGGGALSGIARILMARGLTVSGSDAQDSDTLQALRNLGATCFVGHDAEQVAGADTLVVSTAVRDDNPEVLEARRRGLLLLPRSAAIVALLDGYRTVAVAGTHGKTTTTSMLSVALLNTGADASYAIGADLASTGSNAHHGGGKLFVVEADESDGAFLSYSPFGAIVTNVDADHLDNYGTEGAYAEAFGQFLGRIVPGGFLVACTDDPGAGRLAAQARSVGIETIGVGLDDRSADLTGTEISFEGTRSTMTVRRGGESLGALTLQIPGRHYLLDALAALACGLRLGFGFVELAAGMETYTGTRRRMELKGIAGGVRVFDSYAHHPSEIAADLQGARAVAGDGRLVVCFQPHLVSRTKAFGERMGVALGAADIVVVADIYLAREEAEAGISGRLIADAVPLPAGSVHFEADFDALPDRLASLVRTGDMVLTLGAGDITTVGPELLALLAGDAA